MTESRDESFTVTYAGEQIDGTAGISYISVFTPLGPVRMTEEEAQDLGRKLLYATEYARNSEAVEDGGHEVFTQVVEYSVNCLPEDDLDGYAFGLTVRYRGAGRWAVQRGEHACLGADGEWASGVKPYDRGDDWLDAHRFDEQTALKLAREAAPKVRVNGYTVADALAVRTAREEKP